MFQYRRKAIPINLGNGYGLDLQVRNLLLYLLNDTKIEIYAYNL
jgi:hypothetical protein